MKFLGYSILALFLAQQYEAQPTSIESKMKGQIVDKKEATSILRDVRDHDLNETANETTGMSCVCTYVYCICNKK